MRERPARRIGARFEARVFTVGGRKVLVLGYQRAGLRGAHASPPKHTILCSRFTGG
jgi:hypothetical protein